MIKLSSDSMIDRAIEKAVHLNFSGESWREGLDLLVAEYPNTRFLWSHRNPAKVLGSVCSLIAYCRHSIQSVGGA